MDEDAKGSSLNIKENAAGLLCYLFGWISGLVIYLLERKSRFVRFHAVQSVVTFGALNIAFIVFRRMPFVRAFAPSLTVLAGLAAWIIGMIRAYQGEIVRFPIAGGIAERRAISD